MWKHWAFSMTAGSSAATWPASALIETQCAECMSGMPKTRKRRFSMRWRWWRRLRRKTRPITISEKRRQSLSLFLRRNPIIPACPHYLIHAYDNPVLAPQGVTAARAYSKIAPNLPHALHMPSHIFTRLGLWEDAISSNQAAAAAARKHGDQGEEFHALDYLAYGYLQLGRNEEVEKIRDTFAAPINVNPLSIFKISYAKAAIRARCAVEQ